MKLTFKPFGDNALLIEWEQKIDETINKSVVELSKIIESAQLPEVQFTIPAYCSLTVGYDSALISFEKLVEKIRGLKEGKARTQSDSINRRLHIPVCYEPPYALDYDDVMVQTGLDQSSIIDIHTKTLFRVYMLGFIPGFVYMGKLPEVLNCSRKTTPRKKVPPFSVGLAGLQTGIYPAAAPGGWQIIGRTPVPIFDGTKSDPILFQAGDLVQFYAVSVNEFQSIHKAFAAEQFDWSAIIKT